MSKSNTLLNTKNRTSDWVTVREAVKIASQLTKIKVKDSDIYRHALYGEIFLSIYFQSPFVLKKVLTFDSKVKLRPIENSLVNRLCLLERNCFLEGRNLIIRTDEKHTHATKNVIDTTLSGYEYVLIQCLLARSLGIPLPITGARNINYGISVILSGEIFQVFEKVTYQERINEQIMRLPESIVPGIYDKASLQMERKCYLRGCFPIYNLPHDACFVIRYTEIEKLIDIIIKNRSHSSSSTRISTPLSRLFWLACKNNETISPLLNHPYKLLSIFEQWASTDGITDHLSGDTLKTALERGSPPSTSSSN